MRSLKSVLAHAASSFWLLQICGWTGYFVLNFSAMLAEGKHYHYIWYSLGSTASGFAVTSVLRLGYRRVWNLPTPKMTLSAAAMLLVALIIDTKLYTECLFQVCDDCRPHNLLGYTWYFVSRLYVLLSWSGLYFGIKFSRQLREQKEAALKAQAMAHEAQLKMLRYQLNPHFLFNTLNAISTLVLDRKWETANHMVGSLSAFLRYSLDSDPVQRVTLAQEIDATNQYLGIEQLRFGERLRVRIEVADDARDALVPSLILQPLIENAIKYAVSRREEGGSIEIDARRNGSDLCIALRDDGPGCSNKGERAEGNGHGVGLANTRERLRVLYGERQEFGIGNREPRGAEVRIRLPFEAAAKET
ncbi:MAG TPA: histidine kinase [Rudaea sp.]|nr:histidine kinase [Rudaea sp.]